MSRIYGSYHSAHPWAQVILKHYHAKACSAPRPRPIPIAQKPLRLSGTGDVTASKKNLAIPVSEIFGGTKSAWAPLPGTPTSPKIGKDSTPDGLAGVDQRCLRLPSEDPRIQMDSRASNSIVYL